MNQCEHCESNEVKVRINMEGTSVHLCTRCYNELMAEELEVVLEELSDTFALKDYQGASRIFNVEKRIHPNGIYLEAAENIEFGYKFAVHGELICNQQELLQKLIEKARKDIGKAQVETNVFPNGQAYNAVINDRITGLIEYNELSDGTPLVIIDGKPFTWEELGKMLMAYEGFQMRLEMYDVTNDVD